mmetsp:Transcript_25227/g.42026  ORF Transcript_25227/g.42026 Transcript_25227/m.42026 type:complete len:123 (-) Transcript_25227:122-490(-)
MMEDEYEVADVPNEFKALRSCLRCSLIKTFEQFIDRGCENCEFLAMEGDSRKVQECTTSYFEGAIALVEPRGSWVAKWQRVSQFYPGMYAIDIAGELPEDVVDYLENRGIPYKSSKAASKLK